MAKKCPICGFDNDKEMLFCASCGRPLEGDLKLIMDLKDTLDHPSAKQDEPVRRRDDKEDTHRILPTEEKSGSSKWIWVLLLLLIIVVLCVVFLR